ncbi:polysaccharide deacetylase family protein [Halobacillus salinus]|uniref:polysaccharide deacetylase family protein n=1 Tax=Halobacillus salinus TaxID=192814 RepID=UPI0009A864B6|nr:polysaccharide deacetylase family protein [Halobacillus salinus]
MKQPLIYIVTLTLMFLTACSFIANASSSDQKRDTLQPEYEIDMATDITEFQAYHMTIHYPQTPNNQIDQTIIDYKNEKKAEFKQKSYQASRNQNAEKVHELHIDFDILHQDEYFFVVRFTETMDTGDGDPITTETIMNFGKEQGARLEIKDFFKDEQSEWIDELKGKQVAWNGQGFTVYQDGDERVIDEKAMKQELKDEYAELTEQTQEPSNQTNMEKPESLESFSSNASAKRTMEEKDGKKRVALTFENGPHPKVTPDLLNVLEKHQVEATFFMLGKRVQYYPEVAQAVSQAGHEIGNHTWDHPRMSRLTSDEIDRQIAATQKVIGEAVGYKPSLIRLPFGEQITYNQELQSVGYSVGVEDEKNKQAFEIAQTVLSEVEDGSVIVLSDLHPSVIKATDLIIESLNEQGYEFVTVSEMSK